MSNSAKRKKDEGGVVSVDGRKARPTVEELPDDEALAELKGLEGRMRAGFREVAEALRDICDRKLFLAAGFGNFVDYCKVRANYQKSRAYELVSAGRVLPLLKPETLDKVTTSLVFRPIDGMKTESQVRVIELAAKVAGSQDVALTHHVVADVAEANFGWIPRARYKKLQAEERQRARGEDPETESGKRREALFLGLEAISGIGLGGFDAVQEFGDPYAWPHATEVRQFLNDAFEAAE